MKHAILAGIASLLPLLAFAHTSGEVDFSCPLDNTKFKSEQDYSGTSFGMRLDLKKVGPIAQPWALAQCPKCGFVMFKDEWTPSELEGLRKIVASGAYRAAVASGPTYLCLAVIKGQLGEPDFEVAFPYLQASWQVEGKPAEYRACLEGALERFAKAAASLKDKKDRRTDYLLSVYLQAELNRKLGNYAEALKILDGFPDTKDTEIQWLDKTLQQQKELCLKKDSENHEIAE